jgi:hypothetical protein
VHSVIKKPCPSLLSQMGQLLLQRMCGMYIGGRDKGKENSKSWERSSIIHCP